MKIAVTSQNKKTVTAHAGGCRKFWIYTLKDNKIEGKELLELTKNETLRYYFHEDTTEMPPNKIFNVDILLTGSIGQGGINNLSRQNVKAYIISETDPDTAIEKLINGKLESHAPQAHEKGHSCHH